MEKISVVIPAYNEAERIQKNLKEVIRVFDGFGYKYEIIVVDDGSRDGTYEKLQKIPNIIIKICFC